jgi:peptidoglycan-associated lipoprotein
MPSQSARGRAASDAAAGRPRHTATRPRTADRADIREADRALLTKNAEALKKFDFLRVTIEGHADERGTVEYNLALGERRAKAAYDYLVSLGVAADRLKTVSYGKEVPLCQQSTEDCWARNRRDHFAVTGKARQ